ncbi:hypothetical protein [Paenibacillus sp. TSA_86.1]|uniref:hypothetical protein n=1 Tax=Paenibacillus sp. TSA_86.1 TaxID=3415649 RepID=UPI0040460FFC
MQTRVPYGVISNCHGKGALPDEFPENKGPQEGASATKLELYNNVSIFTPIEEINGNWYGALPTKQWNTRGLCKLDDDQQDVNSERIVK